MKLIPLQQWICDECGEIIQKPKDGWLEWLSSISDNISPHSFRIVHHLTASPQKSCYYKVTTEVDHVSDMPLPAYLGSDGLGKLLMFYREGYNRVKDTNELAEIIRRLHIPHYEEARIYFESAYRDGESEDSKGQMLYTQESIKWIIENYSDEE